MSYKDGIGATKMSDAQTALICARLHLRGGKRRLQKGLTAPGITALYEAVLFGMHYYVARHIPCAGFVEKADLCDAVSLFHGLTRAGVFEDALVFNRFSLIVERALWQGSFPSDTDAILLEVEEILTKLGVLPPNKSILLKK